MDLKQSGSGFAFLAIAVATAAWAAPPAPQNAAFELDGNLVSSSRTDWANLFDAVGTSVPTPKAVQPSGFSSSSFTRDFTIGSNGDETTFTTGSKDTLNVSGWQCGKSSNIGDKVDLLSAYATSYLDPVSKNSILYFGLETASNEGTRDVGFWFLKDGTVSCVANGGKNLTFTGNHVNGDLLITAEYTGSGVVVVNVFIWIGGANGVLSLLTSGADCSTAGSSDNVCGSTNRSALLGTAVPWLTRTKTSNPSVPTLKSTDLDRGEFFEGGLNLTGLGLSACFGRFLADTRSSATPNATLFDYAVGAFASCGIGVSKSCDVTRFATDAESAASGGKNFFVTFQGSIQNTGGSALPPNTPVVIVDDAGTPSDSGDDITFTQNLVNGLAAGAHGPTFSGSFFSNLNPPTNTVGATATVSATAISASPFSTQCTALPMVSALTVTKNCGIPAELASDGVARPGTELVQQSGVLVAQVNVSGQVCYSNPNAAATVPYLDVSAGNQLGLDPFLGALGTPITLSKTHLLPGDCATYAFGYTPASADGSTSPASSGAFTDTVSAQGAHPALSAAQRPFASANARCTICPCSGPSCPAP